MASLPRERTDSPSGSGKINDDGDGDGDGGDGGDGGHDHAEEQRRGSGIPVHHTSHRVFQAPALRDESRALVVPPGYVL